MVVAAQALLEAVLGGDLAVAREAHGTIGRLLGEGKSAVDELAAERARRATAAQLELDFAPPESASSLTRPAAPGPRPGLRRTRTTPPAPDAEVEQLVAGAEPRVPRGGR